MVTFAVRDSDKAAHSVDLVRGLGIDVELVGLDAAGGKVADLVVNATPVGSDGRAMPPLPALGAGVTVVDLLYHPVRTPWLGAAERGHARAFGGLGLLVHQAAESFERWTGVEAPVDVMVAAAMHAVCSPRLIPRSCHLRRSTSSARVGRRCSRQMDDYSALAQRFAVSVHGVRGSLILSRDGLVLGAYPEGDESLAKPAWLKFVTLGEPDRSFVEFADQVWAFVRRGGYAAFSVAEAGIRPGILVDQMEQMLLGAEEGRSRRDTMRVPDAATAPSGKPRTSLHPSSAKPQSIETTVRPPAPPEPAAPEGNQPTILRSRRSRRSARSSPLRVPDAAEDDGSEVDRVLLAKEFSGLLQVDSADDEASP